MAPLTPEEVDVFKIPHSRMKELVYKYCDMMQTTNFTDVYHLNCLLENLIKTFHEFIAHEQIENKYIMKKLKNKLRSLSIQNTAVCNCHKDNQLTDMLSLLEDGYKCTKKSDSDRKNFGLKLRHALEDFTKTFIPHMEEEEEVFQPLLMEHFTFEELKQIKAAVLQQHFRAELDEEKLVTDRKSVKQTLSVEEEKEAEAKVETKVLPDEILLNMFSYLNPKDLSKVSQVCQRWNNLAYDPTLWKELYPVSWSNGNWSATEGIYDEESQNVFEKLEGKVHDEDADIDESDDWDAEAIEIQKQSKMLTSMCKYLLARVGSSIKKCDLAYSKGITNGTLYKILSLCPNIEYLDLTQTRISDLGFKGIEKQGCGQALRHLNLSGCLYITDLTLERVSNAINKLPCHMGPSGKAEKTDGNLTSKNAHTKNKSGKREVTDKVRSSCHLDVEKVNNETGNEESCFKCVCGDRHVDVCRKQTDKDKISHCEKTVGDWICKCRHSEESNGDGLNKMLRKCCMNQQNGETGICNDCDTSVDCKGTIGRNRVVGCDETWCGNYHNGNRNESPTEYRGCRSQAGQGMASPSHQNCRGCDGRSAPPNCNRSRCTGCEYTGFKSCCKDADVSNINCNNDPMECPSYGGSADDRHSSGTELQLKDVNVETGQDYQNTQQIIPPNPVVDVLKGVIEKASSDNSVLADTRNFEKMSHNTTGYTEIHSHNDEKPSMETISNDTEIPTVELEVGRLAPLGDIDKNNKVNMDCPNKTEVEQTVIDDTDLLYGSMIMNWTLRVDEERRDSEPNKEDEPHVNFSEEDDNDDEKSRCLEFLSLSGCYQITDFGLEYLTQNGGLPHLRHLDLSGCQLLSGDAVSELVQTATKLDPSNLFYCDNILDGPFAEVASGCQNLQCSSRMCCRCAQ